MIERATPYPSGLQTELPPATPALSDPTGTAPLVDAALWVQHLLLGSTATMIAVLAIAAIGFLTLSGRIDLRRGATTIIGCFILFGAPSIAAAFLNVFESATSVPVISPPPAIQEALQAPPPPSVYDPYAGASVERR